MKTCRCGRAFLNERPFESTPEPEQRDRPRWMLSNGGQAGRTYTQREKMTGRGEGEETRGRTEIQTGSLRRRRKMAHRVERLRKGAELLGGGREEEAAADDGVDDGHQRQNHPGGHHARSVPGSV